MDTASLLEGKISAGLAIGLAVPLLLLVGFLTLVGALGRGRDGMSRYLAKEDAFIKSLSDE